MTDGYFLLILRTVHSDVVVLAINLFGNIGPDDIPNNHITQMLGPKRCEALPVIHAFTVCDIVSSRFGIGKETA